MRDEFVEPDVQLVTSLRSVGYSFETAIADLIDNSITAEARRIEIDVDVVRGEYVAILDDGAGMAPEVAREALRFAGSVGQRSDQDLGRFGLGLKTASLSQARSLTVLTKNGGVVTALRWDLDYIASRNAWALLVLDESEWSKLPLSNKLTSLESGTLVLWQNLDLLLNDSSNVSELMASATSQLRQSLSLTFHRFLSSKKLRLEVLVNGLPIPPVDPFLRSNSKTQQSATESVFVSGAKVLVTFFTLPHPSNLTLQEKKRFDLGESMRDFQGFYIYRNNRLISKGHWFGLAKMGELSKQTRVQVDIPNSLDSLWQLDIKKSRAEPPASFKNHLRRIIAPVLEKGKKVHTFRGRKSQGDDVTYFWNKMVTPDGFRYVVNIEHPFISSVLLGLESEAAEKLNQIFESLSDTYPTLDLYREMAENHQPISKDVNEQEIREKLTAIRQSGILGDYPGDFESILKQIEPFNKVANLREHLQRIWGDEYGTE